MPDLELSHNGVRLVRTLISAQVQQAAANQTIDHYGKQEVRPGQGGVVLGPTLGDLAGPWVSDHLEPGASIGHPEPAANDAVQLLSCVGNHVVVLDGPAVGSRGVVFGKHGAVLVAFPRTRLELIAPGAWVSVEAQGVGLRIADEDEVVCHSCSPRLLEALVQRTAAGVLRVPVVVSLPAEAAAAGIGMPVSRYNLDLQIDQPPIAAVAASLRFGDIVALLDHDHRFGRQFSPGWLAVGVIAHGRSVGGGHGFGFVTLITGPASRFSLADDPAANLSRLLKIGRAE